MGEESVRLALHDTYITRLFYDNPFTRVLNEFTIEQGKHRVDIAAINHEMHAFEIKSANDTLERLPSQQESYNKVFDWLTLVVDERHVEQAVKQIPSWWGLISISKQGGSPRLDEIWPPRLNLNVDSYALCQLLWRKEALNILKSADLAQGVSCRQRKQLWKLLARNLPLKTIHQAVRQALLFRQDWR